MNNTLPALTLTTLVLLGAGTASAAAPQPTQSPPTEPGKAKHAIALGNGIAGGLLGGPIGFAAGLFIGDWLGNRVVDAYALEDTRVALASADTALASAESRTAALDRRLAAMRAEASELQQIAAASLQFELLFHTGNAELDAASAARVDQLARFLAVQPELEVRLGGHADPRGDNDYNDTLSAERVASVAALLEGHGISPHRISATAFGETQSLAAEGDLDSYTYDRRVDIELVAGDRVGLVDLADAR